MKSFYKSIQRTCAILVGLVFFVSGILKLIDPVGTQLIVHEYYKFLSLTWLTPTESILAVVLPLTESIVGAVLLAGVLKRVFVWVTGVMMLFFTVISILLVALNPEMDCGCFGQAIHLTHVQTLFKNLLLLALYIISSFPLPSLEKSPRKKKGKIFSLAVCVATLTFICIKAQTGLPMVDFTSFAAGTELSGEDSTLGLRDWDGEYCDSFATEAETMLVSIYDPGKMSTENWQQLSEWILDCTMEDITPLIAICSTEDQMQDILSGLGAEAGFLLESSTYFSDYKTLITLNRSNGGATFISDGTIIRKWTAKDRPDAAMMGKLKESDPVEEMISNSSRGRLLLEGMTGYTIALLLLL